MIKYDLMHTRNTAYSIWWQTAITTEVPRKWTYFLLSSHRFIAEKMESENGSGAIAGSDSFVPGVDKGAALLLVIGEPSTEDEKTQILGEITRGRWLIFLFEKWQLFTTICDKNNARWKQK